MKFGAGGVIGGLLAAALACGCASKCDDADVHFKRHVVMFDGSGQPVDPLDNACDWLLPYRAMGDDEFKHHVGDVFDSVATEFTTNGPKDLFVFIHGGLNTQSGSIERARELRPLMLGDGYYPIFINWQSSLISSYFEHLFFVRQGRDEGWAGVPWFPVVLLSDAARTLARAPLALGRLAESMWASLPFTWTDEQTAAQSTAKAALGEFGKALRPSSERNDPTAAAPEIATFPIKVGSDCRSFGEQAWSLSTWVVTAPIKIVTGLLVEGFGTPAWEMMLRRTHLLFAEEERYLAGGIGATNALHPHEVASTNNGPTTVGTMLEAARLAWLFDEAVARRARWTPPDGGSPPRIIACGHSMGAIVLNELVRRDTRRLLSADRAKPASPLFDDLVYMAPACSVADLVDTITPYLELAEDARVHVLVLHPRAEVNESNAFELAPRGSLIDWIDQFLSHPTDGRERRAGSFIQLMLALHEFPAGVRGRVQVHAFGYSEEPRGPQKHGEFTDLDVAPWWRREFWEVWARPSPVRDVEHAQQLADEAEAQAEQVDVK
ncbi:MAG: hypothetical protein IPH13_01885 [Planctomycetes bacterium]|nr:hypothetical protein [Planctomycetota bacterium]MCC7172749.1 hypothetical protein [Planctomycetota bacterium]